MDIHQAASSNLPYSDESFDHVFTVNTICFWGNPAVDLQEIKRVLMVGGTLLISYSPKDVVERLKFTEHGFTWYTVEQVESLLTDSGFHSVHSHVYSDRKKGFVCTSAVK